MKKIIRVMAIVLFVTSLFTMLSIMFLEKKTAMGNDMTFHDAFLITVMLFGAGEPLNLDVHSLHWVTSVFMFLQTLMGLATLTIAFGSIANFLLSEKIAKLMSREKITMKNHVILCGLGNVGYSTVKELEKLNQSVVVIDRGDEKDYIELTRKRGHTVLIENLKDANVLDHANISEAKSVIICTGNDLLNMEVALNARSKRDDCIIVMRMFDQQLAKKVSEAFNLKVAFSSAALSAPVFAAASFDRSVFRSVTVETELFVSARIDVKADSDLVGMKINQLLEKELSIMKLISGEDRFKFPIGDRQIKAEDTLYITCSLDTLHDIKVLNHEES